MDAMEALKNDIPFTTLEVSGPIASNERMPTR